MTSAGDLAGSCVEELGKVYGRRPEVVFAGVGADAEGTAISLSSECPEDARFEIGSLTKTLTGTLLASLVLEGAISLSDDIEQWLPTAAGKGLTVRGLATHTSGLPRLARANIGLAVLSHSNPYAKFSVRRAERALRGVRTSPRKNDVSEAGGATGPSDGGATHQHAYSNFGYQILGLLLERVSGQSYEELLRERILGPLGMRSSGVGDIGFDSGGGVGGSGGGTRIDGHDAGGKVVPHWTQPLPAAGGVEASAGDVARYLAACLAPPQGPLGAAIRLAQAPQLRIDGRREIGLAWLTVNGTLWHNGQTGGFITSLAVNRGRDLGVAALASGVAGAGGAVDRLVLGLVGASQ